MAAPALTVAVKGDPATKKLLDCPFCHRILLTMQVKGIPYDQDYIDFKNKPQWLMDASGGKVPVIKVPSDNNLVLPDSDAIAKYLEDKFPTPSMVSTTPPEIGAALWGAGYAFLKSSDDDLEKTRAAFVAELEAINTFLASQPGPFFGGATLSATDAAISPKLYHMMVACAHFTTFSIDMPAIVKYMSDVKATDAWKACDYGEAAIVSAWTDKGAVMRK